MNSTEILIGVSLFVQLGLVDADGELMFNIHLSNSFGVEWEMSHNYYQLCRLDYLISQAPGNPIISFSFPVVDKEFLEELKKLQLTGGTTLTRTRVGLFRSQLDMWVKGIVENISKYPPKVGDIVEKFLSLPSGPVEGEEAFKFSNHIIRFFITFSLI